jgi:hypothetical protein
MDLLNLILFVVAANTISFTGMPLAKQNIFLVIASVILGFNQEHTVF